MTARKLSLWDHRRGALRRTAIAALAGALAFVPPAQACTSLLLRTTDGGAVYARTMEFGFRLTSEAIVVPRQFAFTATGPGGKAGLVWSSKYGAVGLNAFGLPVLTDGMNERGLAGGTLYFPGYAGYADAAKTDPAKALAP
jgi:choloylglycine hydrolase